MARPRIPFEESTTYEVYQAYLEYVRTAKKIPNPNAFLEKILKPKLGYEMPKGSFAYHWLKLQLRGLIVVDPDTHAIGGPEIEIIVKSIGPADY